MKTKIISISLVLLFAVSLFSFPNANSIQILNTEITNPLNQGRHLSLSLSETIGITTNDHKNNEDSSLANSKNIELVDNVKIEINNLDQGTLVVFRPLITQLTTMDKISNNDRIRFNGKTYVIKNSHIDSTKLANLIAGTHELSNDVKLDIELLEKILTIALLTHKIFYENVESALITFSYLPTLATPQNPTLLVLLVPISGFILYRSEEIKIQFLKHGN